MILVLAHLVNVVVVTVIPVLIWRQVPAMAAVYGPDSPARRILACLYAAIAAASAYALARAALGDPQALRQVALVLFPMQIAYKLATAVAVDPLNPVVMSNLAISVLLAAALLS